MACKCADHEILDIMTVAGGAGDHLYGHCTFSYTGKEDPPDEPPEEPDPCQGIRDAIDAAAWAREQLWHEWAAIQKQIDDWYLQDPPGDPLDLYWLLEAKRQIMEQIVELDLQIEALQAELEICVAGGNI